jgi:hypothetical protein
MAFPILAAMDESFGLISLGISILSLFLSVLSIHLSRVQAHKTFLAEAAERALERFNRINEMLMEKPALNRVFREPYAALKEDKVAKTFIWYIFNQLEGTFLDKKLEILKPEYFVSYDVWLRDQLRGEGALVDFLRKPWIRPYFSESYWKYLQAMVPALPQASAELPKS